ncbi:MAG: sodium-dependent transporter [Oscillospiraceae bacterium]|nr:sodium-dependent transporter [Oscillospiraceae bacterium]
MENKRSSWGSNLGFLLAAIGSAVGLGNIWGFPFKMGKSGGFAFLIIYLLLAVFVGMIIMVSELAVGRKTKLSPIDAYQKISKKFKWIGWLATIAPFLIMSFYSVLGGYVMQYIALNLSELSFGGEQIAISGSAAFTAIRTQPFGAVVFTVFFMILCMVIVQGGVDSGIEKFNKVGMPALFVMLVIVIIRSLTLPNAVEGLKFMFVPGYAVAAGYVAEAPDVVSVLGLAGGQMFFSLSLAMGAILTYGSYLGKEENLVKNSVIIVAADTLIALLAGIAVIPASVSYGISQGLSPAEIAGGLGGPGLLFITLQDVFANMGKIGPLFGVIFYALVLIAAISSAISLIETVSAHWIDKDLQKGETDTRKRIVLIVSLLIMIPAALVAADGLGKSSFTPAALMGIQGNVPDVIGDWLDFMDTFSEYLMMPLGAMLMALMIGWELDPSIVLDEVGHGNSSKGFAKFYSLCVKFIVPVVMAFVLAGSLKGNCGGSATMWYIFAGIVLVGFWIFAAVGKKKAEE